MHYYDPHAPYAPPGAVPHPVSPRIRTSARWRRWTSSSAASSRRFEQQRARGPSAILIVGDHGEGLGDHGESQHGNLLYQATMHVPLLLVGPGVAAGRERRAGQHPAGLPHDPGLGRARSDGQPPRIRQDEIVLGEAMKPFLEYGWQPQVMAVAGTRKAILAGRLEAYDVVADPLRGARPRRRARTLPRPLRVALEDYPVPSPMPRAPPDNLGRRGRGASSRASATSVRRRRRPWCARTRRARRT